MRSKGSRFTLGVWGLSCVRQRAVWPCHCRAYGKFCKRGHFWSFPALRSFMLRGRRGTLWRSDVFRHASNNCFVWHVQHFCYVFRRCAVFSMAGAALWRPLMSFCMAGTTLSMCRVACFCESHCQCCAKWRQGANSVAGVAFCERWWKIMEASTSILRLVDTLHFTLYTSLHTLLSTLCTPHSTLYALHSTLDTLDSTLDTPHSTLYTSHFALDTWHSTLYIPRSTLYTLDSTLDTLHSTLCTLHFRLHSPHFTLYTVHCTLDTTLYIVYFALHAVRSKLYTLHLTLHTPHEAVHPHSTRYTSHFALYTPHFRLQNRHLTVHALHLTFHITPWVVEAWLCCDHDVMLLQAWGSVPT